jgi:hypothetical protein
MSFDFSVWNKTWHTTASAEEKTAFRDWMAGILKQERMNVRFVKTDGTTRDLHCTLRADLIPEVIVEAVSKPAKARSTEVLSVWDLDNAGWRSFKLDSIQTFSFNLGE